MHMVVYMLPCYCLHPLSFFTVLGIGDDVGKNSQKRLSRTYMSQKHTEKSKVLLKGHLQPQGQKFWGKKYIYIQFFQNVYHNHNGYQIISYQTSPSSLDILLSSVGDQFYCCTKVIDSKEESLQTNRKQKKREREFSEISVVVFFLNLEIL